ncbi:MAG: class I SAM-dependent methyltransferase [Phototrophicales bacterium]|nr:class I SAM-dependent methyltransferase [Phototrophicales bacterium]
MNQMEKFKQQSFDDKFHDIKGAVLEIGCGVGKNFHLYPRGCHVTAVEISFKKTLDALSTSKRCHPAPIVINADAQKLPFPSDYYDVIIVSMVLCAVKNVALAIEELNRVAKPNARLLLFEHICSSNQPLSTIQNMLSPIHAYLLGCHLNRNPVDLLQRHFSITHREDKNGIVPWIFLDGYKK